VTAPTQQQQSTTLLERFEKLEDIWPGGALPTTARLGTGSVTPAVPSKVPTDIASRTRAIARRHRKPLIAALVIAGLAAWALFGIAPAIGEGIADSRRDAYLESLESIDGSLGQARTALDIAVADDPSALSDTVGPLAEFTGVTLTSSELAARPLPSTPPLIPRSAIEDLAPLQDGVLTIAARSDSLAQRVNRVVSYRLLLGGAFLLPELPTEAPTVAVDQLSGEISFALAESTDIVLRLPADEFLDGHATDVNALLDRLETWRGEYLQALRAGDSATAADLADEATAAVATLRRGLAEPLSGFASWASKELDEIRLTILQTI
jgi:hypothetical protein